ncbi:MAG: DUF1329 domain-containing protein [Gammaproteobacteria bacterium]|nr:DUF1329 domain-containing protein [Gammaproteobacteria bacterium]
MHIKKYDRDYSRRHFLKTMGAGFSAGVLAPLWDVIAAEGDVTKAYPEELLSLDLYTKGKVKAGQTLDASNVDYVKDLLDEISYVQIKQQGRKVDITETVTDIYKLNPPTYLDVTMKNKGQAKFDDKGNVTTLDGKPWIGGNPFPAASTAAEILAGHNLSWGRYDVAQYCVDEWDMDGDGNEQYHYNFWWCEMAGTGRIMLDPKPYFKDGNILRYQSAVWTAPNDVKGTSILNIWPYDQTQYPDFFGYLPAFKRVRRFPTNQRFEPVIAGSTFFLTDAWMTGDPTLTWGNFKLIGKGPALCCVHGNWQGGRDPENWKHIREGGKSGKKFFRTTMQLVPEVFVVELEPTGYPRAPYSKKRIWFDARTVTPMVMNSFDRRGQVWKQWEGGFDFYEKPNNVFKSRMPHPIWSWTHVHSHDIQSDRITSFEHVPRVAGAQDGYNDPDAYENYLTESAIRRLGT